MLSRVFVLALDGLEYNVVLGGNYSNLMQACYGKLEVPILDSVGHPLSPTVWSSFLAGHKTKIEFEFGLTHKLLAFGKRLFPFLSFGLHKRLAKVAEFPALHEESLLDFVPSSVCYNFPFINYDGSVSESIIDFYRGKIDLDEAIKRCKQVFGEEVHRVVSKVSEPVFVNHNLVMVYSHFPDILHHLAFKREDVVANHYLVLDKMVELIKPLLRDDVLFFVVSDHGFDFSEAVHSQHGFISCNKKIDLPKSIIDFHYYLRGVVNGA